MADVDLVLGVKDETQAGFSAVESSMNQLKQNAGIMSDRTKEMLRTTLELAGAVALVASGYKTISATIGGASGAVKQFEEHRKSMIGLSRALTIQTGKSVEIVDKEMKAYEKLALKMQETLGISDEMALGLMETAALRGVEKDKIDDVAQAAVGLGAAIGKDASYALELLTKAMKGNFDGLESLVPSIEKATTAEEKFAAVMKLAQNGMQAQADSLTSVDVAQKRAEESMFNLGAKIGEVLAPAYLVAADSMRRFVDDITTMVGPALEWLKGVMINAITVLDVAWNNWGKIVQVGAEYMLLKFEQMKSVTEHVFTVAMPAYFLWFAENFTNIMRDAFVGALTIIQNWTVKAGDALLSFIQWAPNALSEGMAGLNQRMAGAFAGGLLEGFEAKTAALPEIAGRRISEMEKDLQNSIGNTGKSLADEFNKKFNENMTVFNGKAANKIKADFKLELNKEAKKADEEKKRGDSMAELQAQEGRLLSRGPATSKVDQMLAEAKQTNKLLADISGKNDQFIFYQNGIMVGITALGQNTADIPTITISGAGT